MVRRNFGGLSAARARAGFTLVELLVVIIIIAILAAIAVPAVMRATATAQNARIKTEIDMLHMAIQQYKNEYGSYPPAVDAPSGTIFKHVSRIFPRMPATNFNAAGAADIQPTNALFKWLSGYASDDPTNPLDPNGKPKKMFDFDTGRVTANQFAPPSKPGSPYIYIDSAHYGNFLYASSALGVPGAQLVPAKPQPAKPSGVPDAWYFTNTNAPSATTQTFFNPDSFQIICAGRDEKFGTDDDMSNFWPSTRKDYLDSLK